MASLWRALGICPGDVVALVGGGGKTSLALACLQELTAAGRRALFTTTTKIYPPERLAVVTALTPGWIEQAAAHLDAGRPCCVAGPPRDDGKLGGLDDDAIAALVTGARPDVLLVEADGAAMLPLKAPADHEPAIPAVATLVVAVAGLGALGRPLAAGQVHRPERLLALAAAAGLAATGSVTPELLAAALSHPELGCARRRPPGSRVTAVLNQADFADPTAAAAAARALIGGGQRRVVLTALASPQPLRAVTGPVAGLLLAAGTASRFGAPKQLALLRGRPLLSHALAAFCGAGLAPLFAVTGARQEAVTPLLAPWPVAPVPNPDFARGMGTSFVAGFTALLAPQPLAPPGWPAARAALVALGDMPNLTPAVLDRLIAAHLDGKAPITAPVAGGERRNPVIIGRALFPELLSVSGDEGGRSVLRRHAAAVQLIPFDDPALFHDVDTPADLDQASGPPPPREES